MLFSIQYTTQVNSTFRARWLASSEVISQVLTIHLRASEEKQNVFCLYIVTDKVSLRSASNWACVVYTETIIHLSQCRWKWWIFTSPWQLGKYPPLFTTTLWIIVKYSSPLNFHVARLCSSAEDHYQPLQFTTKFSPILIGLNCSRGAIVFIHGGPLSAHSACPLKIPGWIVAVREIFL